MNYLKFFPALFLIFNLSNAMASYSEGSDLESDDEEYSSSCSNASAESLTSEDVIIEEGDSEEERKVIPNTEEDLVEKHEREEHEKTELEKARNIAYWGTAAYGIGTMTGYMAGKAILTVGISYPIYYAYFDPLESAIFAINTALAGEIVDGLFFAVAGLGVVGAAHIYKTCF